MSVVYVETSALLHWLERFSDLEQPLDARVIAAIRSKIELDAGTSSMSSRYGLKVLKLAGVAYKPKGPRQVVEEMLAALSSGRPKAIRKTILRQAPPFLEAGLSSSSGRIPQVPRIAITDPNATVLTEQTSVLQPAVPGLENDLNLDLQSDPAVDGAASESSDETDSAEVGALLDAAVDDASGEESAEVAAEVDTSENVPD